MERDGGRERREEDAVEEVENSSRWQCLNPAVIVYSSFCVVHMFVRMILKMGVQISLLLLSLSRNIRIY